MDEDGRTCNSMHVKLKQTPSTYALEHQLQKVALFVPKRMLTMIVPDDVVPSLVAALVAVNQTGQPGDGKVFVAPVEEALRIRTGETAEGAVV
jgi:nitrogen regulatory protein PII 2